MKIWWKKFLAQTRKFNTILPWWTFEMQKFVWFPFHPTIAPFESPVSKSPDGFKQIIQNISNSSQTVYTAVVTNFGLSTFPNTPDFFAILSFSKLTKITWFLPYKTSRFALPGWGVIPRTWSFVIFASWICKKINEKISNWSYFFRRRRFILGNAPNSQNMITAVVSRKQMCAQICSWKRQRNNLFICFSG